jgi:tRNA-2-methylthio-N6-dimethylallyladenosine synthase
LIPITIGCNNFCSYCIVPYVRGREKSIEHFKIIETIKKLVNDSTIEITLLGQNVNSYGKDLSTDYCFSNLLSAVSDIKGLKRIRFMTSHPKDFSNDIIEVIRKNENICKHIHLPIQSGSDKILTLMNRQYTQESYLKIIEKIRKNIPECSITTDIIVGFPGESREDFLQTLKVVEEVRFNRAFTFIYSRREKTVASKMEDIIPASQKKEWFNELLDIQNNISFQENQKLLGKKYNVLVESITENGMLEARLDSNEIVILKGPAALIGKIVDIKIKEAKSFYITGELLEIE